MDELNLENGEWSPVMVGPELLGWAGPHVHTDRSSESRAEIAVLMGDGRFEINVADFKLQLLNILATEDLLNEEEADLVRQAIHYYRHFRVPFPVGSLDISDVGEIEYTTRTVVTLCIGLAKFFKAMMVMVQSELHACATPTEVVRKCAELATYQYSSRLLMRGMYWRGMKLRMVLRESMKIIAAKPEPNREKSYIGLLPAKRHREFGPTGNLQGAIPFEAVVGSHTRKDYGYSIEVPENTFLIRAFSEYEEFMGRSLIVHHRYLLKRFSEATGRAMMSNAIFFLCTAGDSLEEWVDGEVLSVPELAELVTPTSMTGRGWWNWI